MFWNTSLNLTKVPSSKKNEDIAIAWGCMSEEIFFYGCYDAGENKCE